MDDASGLGGLTVADPRAEQRRRLDEFAQRVADEALTAPIPKVSAAASAAKQAAWTAPSPARPAQTQLSRQPAPPATSTSAATSSTVSAGKTVATPAGQGKARPMLGFLLTASAVAGVVALINFRQSSNTPVSDPVESPAPEAPAPEAPPPVETPAPAPAPEDYSYMHNMSDDDLRTYAQSYQPGYDTAASILAGRQAAQEASAYGEAQGNITNLVRFIRNWPSGAYVEYARSDLQTLVQNRRYSSSGRAWLKSSNTYAYRSPTYDADSIFISDTISAWTTTGSISNDGIYWMEISVSVQGQVVSAYVSQDSLVFSDPNYRAPSPPPPPPPPPPAPRYTPPPVTTQPYRTTPAPPPAPIYVTIGSRRWEGEPSDSQSRRIANDMRLRRAISITVDCRVGYDYGLTDCEVTAAPDNITDRQWDGAIEYARLHVAPKYSIDGIATIGNWVSVTFDFKP